MRLQTIWFGLACCAYLVAAPPAWATLGGTLAPPQAAAPPLRSTLRAASHAGYQVQETVLASGTVVREFAALDGKVFAVAWQGPFKPDLQQLLGASFPRLVAAGERPHGDHRSLRVNASDLVIESGGRMRASAGRAYLPALVPATVSLAEIQ